MSEPHTTRLQLTVDTNEAAGRCHYCPAEKSALFVVEGGDEMVLICMQCMMHMNGQLRELLEAARIRRMLLEN